MASFRVGFICDDRLPSLTRALRGKCGARELFTGCRSTTSLGIMRVGWIADAVNTSSGDMIYEWYRPCRSYDAVVYVKSSSSSCSAHATQMSARGIVTVFDANIDYFSDTEGHVFYYDSMGPTKEQQDAAKGMAGTCDGVIADSPHIQSVAEKYSDRVAWVPDNVRDDLVIDSTASKLASAGRINMFWSGQAVKLFELLLVEDVLREFGDKIRLILVTNSLSALDKWEPMQKQRFVRLMDALDHKIVPFVSVEDLMAVYDTGGICLAPRHIDSSYNKGHTEWKITLAMARGVPALVSPLASYLKVHERSGGAGVRVCNSEEAWRTAFAEVLGAAWKHADESQAALSVVREYYRTSVVAGVHVGFIRSLLEDM